MIKFDYVTVVRKELIGLDDLRKPCGAIGVLT